MLKHFDKEDLNQLWTLVKETLSIRQATSDKEKELWVELKRLFEPYFEDQLWTHTQALMHDLVEWRLYDTCGVHHVLTRYQKNFMLAAKDYPLRKGLAIVMISNKLQESLLGHTSLGTTSGLSQVEARVVEFKTQEIKFCEKIRRLEFDDKNKNNKIERLMSEQEHIKKEKEGLDRKLTGFESASKDLDTLLGSQRSDKNKEGLRYNDTIIDYSRTSPSIESNISDLQSSNSSVSKHGESSKSIMSNPMIKFVKAADCPGVIRNNKTETARKSPVKYAKMYRNTTKSLKVRGNQRNWNYLMNQRVASNFEFKNKACYECGSFNHLIKDCSVHRKQEMEKPVWNNARRGKSRTKLEDSVRTKRSRGEFVRSYLVQDSLSYKRSP
uniref:Retrotransposon Orf1 n=1 Tax=Tanacetum cinerariifolium TaxID=118510 RepID=A0A6L2MDI8_TANCI|nr:retrotransposon Orf1 [Tanacetum cinerariifolium]